MFLDQDMTTEVKIVTTALGLHYTYMINFLFLIPSCHYLKKYSKTTVKKC